MDTALDAAVLVAVFCNGFSGLVSLTLWPRVIKEQLVPAMEILGVPMTWLRFPIGFCKAAGALGLLAGLLLSLPWLIVAAAVGLFGYWSCAVFAHLRVGHIDHHVVTTSFMAVLSCTVLAFQLAVW